VTNRRKTPDIFYREGFIAIEDFLEMCHTDFALVGACQKMKKVRGGGALSLMACSSEALLSFIKRLLTRASSCSVFIYAQESVSNIPARNLLQLPTHFIAFR